MKIETLKNICLHCLALGVIALFSSCINDPYDPNDVTNSKGNVEMNITMSLPRIAQPSAENTRALATEVENQVERVNVLVFTNSAASGAPSWEYAYNVRAISAIEDVGDSSKKKFTVSLLRSDTEVNLVILANADTEVTELLKTVQVGDSKDALLAKLISQQTNAADHIVPPFPMCGEVVTAITDQISTISAVPMLRTVARVDVLVNEAGEGSAIPNFTLKEIYIYNTSTKGQIVSTHISSGKATEPTLPSTPYVNSAALVYTAEQPTTSFAQQIYLYEAPIGTDLNRLKNTALVIGGYYNGSTTVTYYRLDFISKDKAYLPVLRNHLYEFKITKVGGRGYTTVDEAWNATESTMEGNVMTWDQGNIGDIVFNNENYISFEPGREVKFAFDGIKNDDQKTVNVKTDCESGFIFTKFSYLDDAGTEHDYPNESDWFEIDKPWGKDNAYGENGETIPVKISVTKVNTALKPRVGFIHMLAGSLEAKITVWQNYSTKPQIFIHDSNGNSLDTLFFLGQVGQPVVTDQQYQVEWYPAVASTTCTVTGESPYQPFPIDKMTPQPSAPLVNSPVNVTFSNLNAMSSGENIKLSNLTYTAVSNGEETSKTLTLIQMVPFIEFYDVHSYYMVNGSKYTFRVRSNREWKIASVTDASNVLVKNSGNLVAGQTGGSDDKIKEDVISFTTINSISQSRTTVTIKFDCTSTKYPFTSSTLTLTFGSQYFPSPNDGWAGSYIYWDGSKMIFDNINDTSHRQAQGILFQWGSKYGISPAGVQKSYWDSNTVMYSYDSKTSGSALGISAYRSIVVPTGTITTQSVTDSNGKTLAAPDRNYLYEKGLDICALITEQNGGTLYGRKWRMPVNTEVELNVAAQNNYTQVGKDKTPLVSNLDDGTFNSNNYYTYNKGIGTPGFAISGYRYGLAITPGQLRLPGTSGGFWTSSPNNTSDEADAAVFSVDNFPYKASLDRHTGFPIRCVISTD